MTVDAIEQARASLPGSEAAALVRTMIEHSVREQRELIEPRVERVTSFLSRRKEINHFSEGIREIVLREQSGK